MQLDEWYLFRLVPFNVNFPNFLAIAAPHQAFLPIGSEVPIAKKSSFPPGEAKNSKDASEYHSTGHSVA